MNLPNKLTILRACMIPVFVVLALMTPFWAQLTAAIVFALASFTDYLDGHIARKHNLVTNFGKFMDPIADKLLVMSAFVVLVGQGRMPSWACIIVLGREFVISGFRSRLLEELGPLPVVFSGGVCSNSLLRQRLGEKYSATFAAPEFSSDNAAGVAVLAWKKRCQG